MTQTPEERVAQARHAVTVRWNRDRERRASISAIVECFRRGCRSCSVCDIALANLERMAREDSRGEAGG